MIYLQIPIPRFSAMARMAPLELRQLSCPLTEDPSRKRARVVGGVRWGTL